MQRFLTILMLLNSISMSYADRLEKLLYNSPTCENRVIKDQLEALDAITQLKKEFKAKLEIKEVKNSSFHINQIKKIIKTLDCSADMLNDVEFVCEPDKKCIEKDYVAHTPWKGNAPVYLCDSFWEKKYSQFAVIIHELTHKCGTLDLEYNDQENGLKTYPRKNYSLWGYSQNADNYEYWAKKEVCIPDVDCPENETDWKMLKDIGL